MGSKEVWMTAKQNEYDWRSVPPVVWVVMIARLHGEPDPLEKLGLTDDEIAQLNHSIEDGWFDE